MAKTELLPVEMQRAATFLPQAMHERYVRRAERMGLSLAAYLRTVLSRVDRELQEERNG